MIVKYGFSSNIVNPLTALPVYQLVVSLSPNAGKDPLCRGTVEAPTPPVGVMWEFGDGTDQVSSSTFDQVSKLRGPSPIALALLKSVAFIYKKLPYPRSGFQTPGWWRIGLITTGSAHAILLDHARKFVPKLLSEEQKMLRIAFAQELLDGITAELDSLPVLAVPQNKNTIERIPFSDDIIQNAMVELIPREAF
ncbi:hypothetical protein TNCV_127411 [Trichonephila clavipes]|nr:hypothetical protein TNCV_127411 [Trichonephila clavipes]